MKRRRGRCGRYLAEVAAAGDLAERLLSGSGPGQGTVRCGDLARQAHELVRTAGTAQVMSVGKHAVGDFETPGLGCGSYAVQRIGDGAGVERIWIKPGGWRGQGDVRQFVAGAQDGSTGESTSSEQRLHQWLRIAA